MLDAVSHDIRGAFGIISGLISVLPLAGSDSERDDIMYRLQKNSGYAFHMFSVLQDYSIFSSGKYSIETSDFQTSILLTAMSAKWSTVIKKRNIHFSSNTGSELYIHGDSQITRKILEHIIFSLLNKNKLRSIAISWSVSEEGKAVCSITSQGISLSGRTLRLWNEKDTDAHWENGDDLSLNVALLMCHKLNIETKVTHHEATQEIGFRLGFVLSCPPYFP